MEKQTVLYEVKDSIAVVTINEPKTMNCLTQNVLDDLLIITRKISADESIRAVILTGEGKAFCAGGDLNRFLEGFTLPTAMEYVDNIHFFCREWSKLKKPTIAAVNGPAVGAGMSITLLCDIAIGSENAKLGSAFINMGLIPDMAMAYYLPRTVGPHKAMELLMTGEILEADEAERLGLLNKVVPASKLMDEAWTMAKKIAKGPSFAIWNTKRVLKMSLDMDFENLLELESCMQAISFSTEDSTEAVNAFLQKRQPKFK